jgi:hypothetical protein
MLRRSATLAETARLVSFVASEEASTLTGAIINSSNGLVLVDHDDRHWRGHR